MEYYIAMRSNAACNEFELNLVNCRCLVASKGEKIRRNKGEKRCSQIRKYNTRYIRNSY